MRKIVIGTYYGDDLGQDVINQIERMGMPRSQIGYAVEENPKDEARRVMVTVATDSARANDIEITMKNYSPIQVEQRDYQWLKGNVDDVLFDIENFEPLEVAKWE